MLVFFDNNDGEIRQSLSLTSKRFDKILYKQKLTYFDLTAQVMSIPCTSETILPPSTFMLRISFCS